MHVEGDNGKRNYYAALKDALEEAGVSHTEDELAQDDRWDCAGLGPALVHAGRALVSLSLIWEDEKNYVDEDNRDALAASNDERTESEIADDEWLAPRNVYQRVVSDLSSALGLSLKATSMIVGDLENCQRVDGKFFPKIMEWEADPGRSGDTMASLWNTYYQPEGPEAMTVNEPVNEGDEADAKDGTSDD